LIYNYHKNNVLKNILHFLRFLLQKNLDVWKISVLLHSQSDGKGKKEERDAVKDKGDKFFESLKPKPGKGNKDLFNDLEERRMSFNR
jgi:hypothetical protein